MKLNEFCKKMGNISRSTGLHILKENNACVLLGGQYFVTKKGMALLERLSPPSQSSNYMKEANRFLCESDEDNGESLEQTAKADGSTIAIVKDTLSVIREQIKKLQNLTLNSESLSADLVYQIFSDNQDLADVLLNIDTYLDTLNQQGA